MKIKNTSTKIVHIGTTTILPDEVGSVDDSLKNAPVVSMFVERGDIKIVTGKAGKGGKKATGGTPDTGDTQDGKGEENGDKGESEGE